MLPPLLVQVPLQQVNGSYITWDDIKKLWEKDVSGQLYMTKLTYDHINLTPQR